MTVSHSFSMAVVLSVLWSVAALESTEKAEGEVTAPNVGNLNLALVLVITYSPRCARGTVKSTLCEFFSSSSCRCKIHAAFPLSLVNVKLFADRLIWFSAQYWCSACVLLDQQTKPNTIQNNTIQMITTYLSRVFRFVNVLMLSLSSTEWSEQSFSASLVYGTPQGSILGPLPFLSYLLTFQHIFITFKDISYHC